MGKNFLLHLEMGLRFHFQSEMELKVEINLNLKQDKRGCLNIL